MTLGLLAYALNRSPTGIGHYTRNLFHAFSQLGLDYHLLIAGAGPYAHHIHPLHGASLAPALLTLGQLEIAWYAHRFTLNLLHDPIGLAPFSLCHSYRLVTIHDVFPLSFPGHSTIFEDLLYRFWLPLILTHFDVIITVSQNSKQDICKFLHIGDQKVIVIPAASTKHFRYLPQEEVSMLLARYGVIRPYILYVGSVEPRKNLLRMLDAYQLLLRWSDRWKFMIVGARNYWKSYPVAQKVEQLGLQDQVIFTGYIPDEDLPALYNGAELFCFPSLYEGFGLPVLEAMACGVPVVTSNCSSLPEVAGDAAILVDPYNVDEIADAMKRVLSDRELAQELRHLGLERAKQFSWEKTARETIAVYEKVLGEKLL
jgi:glycosyltransferase involved in cell wall biosynthesis